MSARAEFALVYWLFIVFYTWNNIVESRAVGKAYEVDYLKQFGYISESKSGQAASAFNLKKSLRALQQFAGLNVTGEFDDETQELMKAPRCGDKDPIQDGSSRRRRYILEGSKWRKKDLTYRILNDPYRGPTNRDVLTPELISKTIKAALQKWSFAADLIFTELKEGEADIMIKFTSGEHGDKFKFDGRGKTLAHAFYPSKNKGNAGDVHFDLDERFSLTEEDSVNFVWVTTHEFGHSLGLRHSSETGAIMYPWYTTGEMGNVKLSKDDKRGIQVLYGKSAGRNTEKRIVLPRPPRKECKYSFNVLFHDKHHKRVFAFKDHEFYVLTKNGGESKGMKPRVIEKRWEGLTNRIRAAYTRNDGHTIFFTRHRYYEYSGTRRIRGPTNIEELGLNKDLRDMDAAVSFPGNGGTYFFKGDDYWKYDEKKKALYPGYPKLIKLFWRGLPDNIDSALQTPNGETYFFKGLSYYRFSHFNFNVYPGYPRPIGPDWLGCTEEESGYHVTSKDGTKSASLGLRPSFIAIFVALIWIVVR